MRFSLPHELGWMAVDLAGGTARSSRTGRWAERLSLGITRALTASLVARLQDVAVTATPPVERPTWRVLVDVTSFDPTVDRQVVFAVRWTITDGAGRQTLVTEQASFVEAKALPQHPHHKWSSTRGRGPVQREGGNGALPIIDRLCAIVADQPARVHSSPSDIHVYLAARGTDSAPRWRVGRGRCAALGRTGSAQAMRRVLSGHRAWQDMDLLGQR